MSEEAKKQNSGTIEIPFNRQQLADFLSVDRSAMSNELCKMRNEGLLEFDKNNNLILNLTLDIPFKQEELFEAVSDEARQNVKVDFSK